MLETKKNVEKTGNTCRTYKCDVSSREEVKKLGADIRGDFRTVDILVNNAGVVQLKNFLELNDSEIRKTIEVNLFGTIWMTKEFLPDITDRNEGHVVNMSSMNGFTVAPLMVHYCASKFGVNGFGQALNVDLENLKMTGIHLTTVYPGPVDTPTMRECMDTAEIKFGTGCLAKPEDVAEKIVDSVLIKKRYVYIPESLRCICAMRNLLPVESLKMLDDYQKELVELKN